MSMLHQIMALNLKGIWAAECDVPKYVLQAIVDDMLPDIRAFFESEEGKREFEEWKAQRVKKKVKEKRSK